MIAEDIATATSEIPWSTDELNLVKSVMVSNRDSHNHDNDKKLIKSETEEPDKKKPEPFINKVFGHDQSAIEGFKDCEGQLQKNLNLERAERDSASEFKGAVKTEKNGDAQRSDDDDGKGLVESPNLNSQEADNEGEDQFRRLEFKEMGVELLERASKVFQKIKATIKVISRSLPGRGKVVVETAVNNDVRPGAFLAADDTSGIYKDKEGKAYGEKGARSSQHLIHEIGLPPQVVAMPIPREFAYQKGGNFKWTILDDQRGLPNASVTCSRLLKRVLTNGVDKWNSWAWGAGSRILNAVLRHSETVPFQQGGWVTCPDALRAARSGLNKSYGDWVVTQIVSIHWLFGLLHDATLKS